MCLESTNSDTGELSQLACQHHNYAGMKAAPWQQQYGADKVNLPTQEWYDGGYHTVDAWFCSCPDFDTWLKVYSGLLTSYYRDAYLYTGDAMLFGSVVWTRGWATSPDYLVTLQSWMRRLWDDFSPRPSGLPTMVKGVPLIVNGVRVEPAYIGPDNHAWAPVGNVVRLLGWKATTVDMDGAMTVHVVKGDG